VKEPNHRNEVEELANYREILYRRHFQGALVRSVASAAMWFFALAAFLVNLIRVNHFIGVSLSVLYLILINPPTLLLLKRITQMRLYRYASLLINFLEVLGYTAIIYFLGGIEATYVTPIYAALITYVGVVSPRSFPFIISIMCSAAFTFMLAAEYFGFLPHQYMLLSSSLPLLRQLSYVSVAVSLLFVVAYIASLTGSILKKSRDKLKEKNLELMEKTTSLEEAEKGLRRAHQDLENRVKERTAELREANDQLRREIKERGQTEEALRESEDRYRDLVEHSHDLLCTHDLEGKLLSVNPAALKGTGYSKDELLGMSFRDFLAPEVRGQFGIYLTEIQAKGAASGVMLVQTKGGEKRLWEYNNTLRTEGIVIPIVRGMARDITERRSAEKALQDSENRYRTLVENSNDGIALVKEDVHLYVNQKFKEIFGYNHIEEIVGRPISITIHPDDRDRVLEMNRRRQTKEEEPSRYEFKGIRKDGSIVYIEVSATQTTYQGEAVSLSYHRDITDRKKAEEALRESEEKYRTILENIEDGYYEVDLAGNFTFYNDSLCKILGYSRDEMNGMNNRQYTDQENGEKLLQAFNKVYRTGKPAREFDWEILKKDGAKRSIETSVSIIIDPSDNRIGFRGIVRDITERKRIEEEKSSLQEQLRQSQKIEAIGRLAGGIAHDFNNLLTVIKGYSQLSLHELKEDVPLRGNIDEIKRASEKAADLTRQLLAFSRRQILEMKVLDLNTVLRDMDKILHRLIGEDIELITLLADDLGRVKTDPGWVEQITMNLAVNARDAMPSIGKLTIETANVELDEHYARAHVAVTPGRYVMLSVSDTGVGMTPEVRQQVFEPFFTTKEKGKGTGLGLSTVYGIVKQSGGNIWVYSEPGQGTTFKIYLPRVDEPLEEFEEKVVKEELPRGSETILLVEDEEVVRKLAVRILKRQGYTVLEGSHGNEAIDVCKHHMEPVHLLLTDVVMPGMNGRELAERFKPLYPKMKVLYMSGYTDDAITHHGVLEEGMNYLQKPFTVDGLTRKVREVLDK
jgi:PAS domain S-box-containing protein